MDWQRSLAKTGVDNCRKLPQTIEIYGKFTDNCRNVPKTTEIVTENYRNLTKTTEIYWKLAKLFNCYKYSMCRVKQIQFDKFNPPKPVFCSRVPLRSFARRAVSGVRFVRVYRPHNPTPFPNKTSCRRAAAMICPAPLLPLWAPKRFAPPSR